MVILFAIGLFIVAFLFLQKKSDSPHSSEPPQIRSCNYDDVSKILKSSHKYLNNEHGHLFIQGVRLAYQPISQAVGNNLPFGDTIQAYAEQTKHDPDQRIKALNALFFKDPATEAGFRFLTAMIILAYGNFGIYPCDSLGNIIEGSILENIRLQEESIEILGISNKYAQ